MKRLIYFVILALIVLSCGSGEQSADAYGNFTATEVVVSAEGSGKILIKNNSKGEEIEKGVEVYVIDTTQNQLKKNELLARKQGIYAKRMNIKAQIAVQEEQKKALVKDIDRFKKMLTDGAVSQKQIDDLENKLTVLEKQIDQVNTNFIALDSENEVIATSLLQVEDLLIRSKVKSPVQGTILETYAEAGETVIAGKPLFRMADLTTMELKAYFSGNQLARIKIYDSVEVLTDKGNGDLSTHKGRVVWIASEAEFTPKIIQTREERINLVYAVKISVPNDGTIKINMPGEVRIVK